MSFKYWKVDLLKKDQKKKTILDVIMFGRLMYEFAIMMKLIKK